MRAEMAEEMLLSAAKAGDLDALARLYVRHQRRLRGVIGRLVPSDFDVDDVLQDTWIASSAAIALFRAQSSFATWLIGIGKRLAYDAYTQTQKQRFVRPLETLPSPHVADQLEAYVDIGAAVRRLPAACRRVFLAHDVEGDTHEAISDRLGITIGGSKALLHRSRRKLRVALSDYEPI